MIVSLRLSAVLVATIVVVAACSSAATVAPATAAPATAAPATAAPATAAPASAAPASAAPASAAPAASATVIIGEATSATLVPILTGPDGLTLYTHAGDTSTSSTCTGACLTAWPPLYVTDGGEAVLEAGLIGSVSSFTRGDGSGTQVTFNGMPLYYYMKDVAAGDTKGQGINGFTVAPAVDASSSGSPAPSGS